MTLNADADRILIGTGEFPLRCLPAALHESAHHYCFSMPVGHALSACFLEAIRTYLADPASSSVPLTKQSVQKIYRRRHGDFSR